jgi:hypothetical protein
MGAVQTDDVPRELDHRALHAQADPEERDSAFPGETNRIDLPLDAPFAKAAGHQHSVIAA